MDTTIYRIRHLHERHWEPISTIHESYEDREMFEQFSEALIEAKTISRDEANCLIAVQNDDGTNTYTLLLNGQELAHLASTGKQFTFENTELEVFAANNGVFLEVSDRKLFDALANICEYDFGRGHLEFNQSAESLLDWFDGNSELSEGERAAVRLLNYLAENSLDIIEVDYKNVEGK